jgi:hypothetical protein
MVYIMAKDWGGSLWPVVCSGTRFVSYMNHPWTHISCPPRDLRCPVLLGTSDVRESLVGISQHITISLRSRVGLVRGLSGVCHGVCHGVRRTERDGVPRHSLF